MIVEIMEETGQSKWKDLFNKQASKVEESDVDSRPDLIDSYFFIYDCIENEIAFVNNAFQTVTGYPSEGFNLKRLMDMIHPEDQDYFFKCEEVDLEITNNLAFNEHFQFLFTYSYRILTANQEIYTIQQQCQAIEVTKEGHLSKTLVIHKRIPDYDKREMNDHKIFDKAKGIYIDADNCYNLSKRELEILNLIKDGLNSNEISDRLNISKFTIDTHRKNILNKTSSANFIELIKKLSFVGFNGYQ